MQGVGIVVDVQAVCDIIEGESPVGNPVGIAAGDTAEIGILGFIT